MSIQTLHDTGEDYKVINKYDGGVYAAAVGDCVCGGIGDQFTLNNYSSSSLNVQFSTGSQAVIGGSFFKVTASESITLDANKEIYLCATIDLSRSNGSRGYFEQRTQSNMRSDNLNGNGTVRDLLLYVITTNATGVVSVEDRRLIVNNGSTISGYALWAGTQAEYNALPASQKTSHHICFIKETS